MKNRIFSLFLSVYAIVMCILIANVAIGIFYPVKYYANILYYCDEYEISPSLVLAVIKSESNFDKNIISHSGAMGLMQILPSTANAICQELEIENYSDSKLLDADFNIKIGTYYLSYLSKKFSTIDTILFSYNAGEGNVYNWIENPQYLDSNNNLMTTPFKQTNYYKEKVLNTKKIYDFILNRRHYV